MAIANDPYNNQTPEQLVEVKKKHIIKHLPSLLSVDRKFTIEFVICQKGNGSYRMHNRYILTDRGGLKFPYGLDIQTGTDIATDIVNLLQDNIYPELYEYFSSDKLPDELGRFDLILRTF